MAELNFKSWRQDLTSGTVVFLVALPLCLGIALASGAPLFSGVISGIIAGTLVAYLSGSELSISGPAAGLSVIVSQGILTQGSFENFLVALVIAGGMQVCFGILRAGEISSLVPTTVMRGMMAAIGLTIILRQIPHALGAMPHFESESEFWDIFAGGTLFTQYGELWQATHGTAVAISALSMFVYITWESYLKKKFQWFSFVPGALIAVLAGTLVNQLFHLHDPGLALHEKNGHLVALPEITGLQSLLMEFRSPNWAVFTESKTWWLAFTVAIVGSVEALLCLEATDKQDSQHRISDTNKELIAQGIGNSLCGFIGGLPVTAVLVRSSTNVFAGAQSRLSGMFQGIILIVSVLFFANILNLIPLATLASILIIVGYRLTKPMIFRDVLREGWEQFVPFIITVVAILCTDLLRGIVIGFISASLFIIWTSYYSSIQVVHSGMDYLIKFTKDVTFIHRAKLKRELMALPPNSRLLIDGSRALYIDHDIYSTIEDFKWVAKNRNIKYELVEVENKKFSRMTKTIIRNRNAKRSKDGKLSKAAAKQ